MKTRNYDKNVSQITIDLISHNFNFLLSFMLLIIMMYNSHNRIISYTSSHNFDFSSHNYELL